jgi:hypothetical protein
MKKGGVKKSVIKNGGVKESLTLPFSFVLLKDN